MKTDREFILLGLNQEINAIRYKIRDDIFERRLENATDLLILYKMIEELAALYAKRELLQKD